MSTGLIDIMKRASMDAMDNAQMCDLRYGTVVSVNPLKVQITDLFTIPESLLVVPQHLTNHSVNVTVNWLTDSPLDYHNHPINGEKTMTINNALKVNDKVALLRKQGGQSYFILDRI
jgi:hypothetical protein